MLPPLPLLLTVLDTPQVKDADVLRTALAAVIAPKNDHAVCVTRSLDEPPFAGLRRELAEDAADRHRSEPNAAARQRALEQMLSNWAGSDGAPLDSAEHAEIIHAAVVLAQQGDPRPKPVRQTPDMLVTDVGNGSVPPPDYGPTSEAGLGSPPDAISFGFVQRDWLTRGQRLGGPGECDFPSISLSAVAREGVWAFVDVGIAQAPLAGVGQTWAFRREQHGWRRIAIRLTWVS